jgi:hypothetical protein
MNFGGNRNPGRSKEFARGRAQHRAEFASQDMLLNGNNPITNRPIDIKWSNYFPLPLAFLVDIEALSPCSAGSSASVCLEPNEDTAADAEQGRYL